MRNTKRGFDSIFASDLKKMKNTTSSTRTRYVVNTWSIPGQNLVKMEHLSKIFLRLPFAL